METYAFMDPGSSGTLCTDVSGSTKDRGLRRSIAAVMSGFILLIATLHKQALKILEDTQDTQDIQHTEQKALPKEESYTV